MAKSMPRLRFIRGKEAKSHRRCPMQIKLLMFFLDRYVGSQGVISDCSERRTIAQTPKGATHPSRAFMFMSTLLENLPILFSLIITAGFAV